MDGWPEGFLWGAATAAHQVEGGNWNSDWWAWEHDPASPCSEPSGDAADHYHLYPADIARLAELGFNAYRFSIEWARIEPERDEFSPAQLDHYRRMLEACHDRGLTPVVTFHHFTSPRWVMTEGGWEEARTAERFARYCATAARHLGDLVPIVCTINEPNMPAFFGYRVGFFPPGKRDPDARRRATETFIRAHRLAVEEIKAALPDALVGMTLALQDMQAVDGGEARRNQIRRETQDVFLEAARGDDFIGVQTYTRERIAPDGVLGPEAGVETTIMGYEFWPEALEASCRRASQFTGGTPIIVTENGIATDDDERRIAYVRRALQGLHRCLEDDIDIRGYIHWSLLDNFEWVLGYTPTYGLIAVDRVTQQRTPKPSATWLGDIARRNAWPLPDPTT